MTTENQTLAAPCPVCGKPAEPSYKPFCSKKCADIDLGRWLKGVYVVHTDEAPTDEDRSVPDPAE